MSRSDGVLGSYRESYDSTFLAPEDFQQFDLAMPDDMLDKMLIQSLNDDVAYWNKAPFSLKEVDNDNVRYLLSGHGEAANDLLKTLDGDDYPDNRMFAAIRAILSYATGQLTKPDLTPSNNQDQFVKMARNMEKALYQHSLDEDADVKFRAAVMNLITRKRGFLKLRYDPDAGMYGDVVTDVCNPEDIVFDRFASFLDNPAKIYHRQQDSVEALCDKFPDKRDDILSAYGIKQGRFTQMSRMVSYWECWFTYRDKGVPKEAVAWVIPEHHMILGKMPNPNWVYTGDAQEDKQTNVLFTPPKPFIWFNYLNLGRSAVDETSLFDQAKPLQEALNYRLRQFNKAVSLANGRWLYDKSQISEETANRFVNRGGKTLLGVDYKNATRSPVEVLAPSNVAPALLESIIDSRDEIDGIMGTPSIFKGANPQSQDTLGRDQMVKAQAGMLQDDLVRAVANGAKRYYQIKLQMFRTYYTDDYYFNVKGGDGKYDLIMLSGDTGMDTNVKIGVGVDSNLPIDKAGIRGNAMMLAKLGRIDDLTLFEDLGVTDPEIRAERLQRSKIDLYTYMQSIEQGMDNNDAETDIMLLVAGKSPSERDVYDEGYFNYFNDFITTNRFTQLPGDAKQRIVEFLQTTTQKAQQSADLQSSMLNDAGIIDRPPVMPLPKRTMNIRLNGNMSPQQTQQIAGGQAGMAVPVTQLENAQDPAQGGAPPAGPPQ